METTSRRAIAIVGTGAVLPDAPNVPAFWENIKKGRYSISEVDRQRWDPALYYDPDHSAPDKTYSKIGGWVRDFAWDPVKWHLPVPPRVVNAMDEAQKWAIACTRQALEDYGYPKRPLDPNRTAVILGNAMAGEKHYLTALRISFPEYARELSQVASFAALPENVRKDITCALHDRIGKDLPEVTEDSMPGELANCIAGRIANLFNFHGPNYVCDAACASAMAAISSAIEGLVGNDFDVAVTGGIDRNMGAPTFVKFCKIGALSATGTRPYADGADGFVMGEGAAIFLLKRLADAERDGDRIYAVLRGIGGSSDGKGKGITAPNPIGQKLAIERAWANAALSPATVTYVEGHGTSTRVGDVVEVQSLADVLSSYHLAANSVGLGSVKSNFGHLKGAAGAAGLLKAILALCHKVLPPSLHFERPNPDIDFAHSPLYVNTELKPWDVPPDHVRRAGVSAFGFGGTNFHVVLEEYIPHRLNGNGKRSFTATTAPTNETSREPIASVRTVQQASSGSGHKTPLRGALVIGASTETELVTRLRAVEQEAKAGHVPALAAPNQRDLAAPERLAIGYADGSELTAKVASALKALNANQPAVWKALRAQGIFRGHGPAPKVAFLYPGQGSQYVNMLKPLLEIEPTVADTFAEADRVMTPLLGKPLSAFIFVDQADDKAVSKAEEDLRQTAITQPAVLAVDLALTRLLAAYGIKPDFTMGHSLGEYAALVAAGAMPFADALEAVSARGREMTRVSVEDNGRMAAVFAPFAEIERLLKTIDGYVVIANVNSEHQSVIGGASNAVERAMEIFQKAGYEVTPLPVSHAFHTSIVAPASEPLRHVLERLHLQSPAVPVVANTNGKFYPTGAGIVPQMLDILAQQVASPVQFVTGLRTLYEAGARLFVEVGPKKALQGLAEDVLGSHGDVVSLFTNHPKVGDIPAFNQALCCLYAAGLGQGAAELEQQAITTVPKISAPVIRGESSAAHSVQSVPSTLSSNGDNYVELGRFFADVLERGWQMTHGQKPATKECPVTITGASLGLPGTEHIFDDGNIGRLLRGDQFIDTIPTRFRRAMVDKHITRLVKSEDGSGSFETITDAADVIKLAGRGGAFDLEKQFGVSAEWTAALDRNTQLAIAVGIDALRDAGIPLVLHYKTTSKGTQLPDRWMLPEALRDDTGVIFASAFPGMDSFADEMSRYYVDRAHREQLEALQSLRARFFGSDGYSTIAKEIDRRMGELREVIEKQPYVFDRRYLFRILSMGHSQFAQFIGARGPNTQINAACASTAQAVALAEDWIRARRCRRVVVIAADDVTTDNLIDWIGAGFLASGAAATDEVVEEAAVPFDRRRHGMIIGMGAAGLVVESPEAARERGVQPICEVLSAVTANSAFHGTRLDVEHISRVMEDLIARAEAQSNIRRDQIASRTVFVSHETYTPARGGSAAAEIQALRRVFGNTADQIVIANTKGFTGHAMAAGLEDVLAVKALETGIVPPVANFKEVDPELGPLNLSKGGVYPVEYALRLGAGFGSQISMTLLRWVATQNNVRQSPNSLGYAYRIINREAWNSWLSGLVGRQVGALEVVHRTLRVPEQGTAARFAVAAQGSHIVTPPLSAPSSLVPMAAQAYSTPGSRAIESAATPEVMHAPAAARAAVSPVPELQVPDLKVEPSRSSQPANPLNKEQETDAVKDRILGLVEEKTGYPREMLDLDLDLEADLGIDTVKQAEMFTAIRETYNIPRDENRKLRDYPTLAHVIRFVYEKRPDLAKPGTPASSTVSAPHKQERDDAGLAAIASGSQAGTTVLVPAAPEEFSHSASTTNKDVSQDVVTERILALVAEKTGYPKEMLDLDLDLEADLGIDTVKQAEVFAEIREIYEIPRDENRKLRDYPTLAHVIRFVHEKSPDLATAVPLPSLASGTAGKTDNAVTPTAEALTPETTLAKKNTDPVEERILDLVVEKTGYPKEMLDLDLDLEADLGVDTVKQAEMFATIREIYDIPRDENRKLRDYPTLAHVIRFVHEKRPDLPTMSRPASALATTPSESSVVVPARAAEADSIKERVLEIAAEKTGYPKDMLDLDLDLEADLGIDTVKQAEMFAAIRAAYNIPRDENLKLRDFPTLAHVIRFAEDRSGVMNEQDEEGIKGQTSATSSAAPSQQSATTLNAAKKNPRRVPLPVLRPPLSICKPTGVSLTAHKRVIVMADKGGAAAALVRSLIDKGLDVLSIEGAPEAEALTKLIKSWTAAGPIDGVYWLPALDYEGNISDLDHASWSEGVRVRIKLLYTTMRALYEHVAKPGTFFISATRLGGQHGYDEAGALGPLGGGVVGFAKSYKRERPEALVKAVDFELERKPAEIADLLIEETLRDPGAIEIGYKEGLRWTIGLQQQPAGDGLTVNSKTVFLITGAAGSIVSAITSDLAAASGGTFYLLDLAPKPDPDNPDLKRFVSDKEGLKRDIFSRIQSRGERATPALVEKELAGLEREQAAQSAIDAVRAAGGTAHYISVDLRDAEAVAKIVDQVRQQSGRIDVLLHAAGLDRSRSLADKEPGEFDLVFDVKAYGFFNLLRAIGDMPLGVTVAFSSIAGRFGNAGQTDYASANDLLCKITSNLRTARPTTRCIAIDWTAWAGIGMASRGSIPKIMEMAGIDMLQPEAGIAVVRNELTSGEARGEVVIGERLGVLVKEWDETGGIDNAASQIDTERGMAIIGPMLGKLVSTGVFAPFSFETTLDPKIQPFLYDHQIDGTPVLPGVMGIEAFAEVALALLPGWHVAAIEDVNYLAPFKFYRHEPRTVTIEALIHPQGSGLIAECQLVGSRTLPGQAEPLITRHFTGRVRLTKEEVRAQVGPKLDTSVRNAIDSKDIYRLYFHGPAYQVIEKAWWNGERVVGMMARNLPKDHHPSELPTFAAPRLVELCFQTAGIWEMGVQGRMGLPLHIDHISLFGAQESEINLYAVVTPCDEGKCFNAEVVDDKGNCYLRLSGYRTVEFANAALKAEHLKALRALMSPESAVA